MYEEKCSYKKAETIIENVDHFCYGCGQRKSDTLLKNKCPFIFGRSTFDNQVGYVIHGRKTFRKTSNNRLIKSEVYWNGNQLFTSQRPKGCNKEICKKCMGNIFYDCYKYNMWTCKMIPHCASDNKNIEDFSEMKNACKYYMEHVVSSGENK